MSSILLEIRGLRTEFPGPHGTVRAARDVDLTVREGEIVGLVGESGCGKSVLLRSILGLLPPAGRIVAGEVRFKDKNLLTLPEQDLRAIRGGEITLIPQDPLNAFNPALSIGYQMRRALKLHRKSKPEGGWEHEAEQMLRRVGVDPSGKLGRYSFNFSQGQLQRVMTAMAILSGKPRLLLADEPTTSLDVTIEAQILWLISQLQREIGMAVIFVSHDLGVIGQLADRVAVMYAGSIVEEAPVRELFRNPQHPYTIGLLKSSGAFNLREKQRLFALSGAPPDLSKLIIGCPFAPRCEWASDVCREVSPGRREIAPGQTVACHHAESIVARAS